MTAPRRIVLHLGFPKTGSTTLQALVRMNARTLAPYLTPILRPSPATLELRRACMGFHRAEIAGRDLGAAGKAVRTAAQALLAAAPGGDSLLLVSDESFSGLMPGATADTRFFPCLPRLAQLLDEGFAGQDTRFFVMTRAGDPWIVSAHNQAVRTDGCTLTLDEFRAGFSREETIEDAVAALRAAVGAGRVGCVAMEDDMAGPAGIGTALLRFAGVPEPVLAGLQAPPRRNPGFGASALEFMRLLNAAGIRGDTRRTLRSLIATRPELFRD